METKIVIHIGMHKTGTTFLQREVFPKIPNINYQTDINLFTPVVSDAINLFSDENLDGGSYRLFTTCEQRDTIIKNLHTLYPDAHIILCLRDKESWLHSAYKQYIVAYQSCSFKEYKQRLDTAKLDYAEYISLIKSLFNHVYVCYYNELKKNPQQFVNNLCDFIGVKTPPFNRNIVYKSITDTQVKLIRLYDKLLPSKLLHFLLSLAIRFVRNDSTIIKWLERTE